MYIFFDSNNDVTSQLLEGEKFRQGDVNANTIYVHSVNWSNSSYMAWIQFERADGTKTPEIPMVATSFTYNAVLYNGFSFTINDPDILSQYGQLKTTIRYKNGAGVIKASGTVIIAVEQTVYEPSPSITLDQYNILLSLFDKYLQKVSRYYPHVVSAIPEDLVSYLIGGELLETLPEDLTDYELGAILFVEGAGDELDKVYEVYDNDGTKDLREVYDLNEYLSGTVLFVKPADSTEYTIYEVYDNAGTLDTRELTLNEIADIKSGATIVKKAEQDEHGNTIDSTYGNYLSFAYDSATRVLTINLYSKDDTLLDTKTATIALSSGTVNGLMSSAHYTKLTALPTNAELLALLDLKALISETGNKLATSYNSETGVLTIQLLDKNDNVLSTQTEDLPLELIVESGEVVGTDLILTLANGETITIPVGSLLTLVVQATNAFGTDERILVADGTGRNAKASSSKVSDLVPTSRTIAGKALTSDITLAKGDVGLGNVDNTSDNDKPISSATQLALGDKADQETTYTKDEVDDLLGDGTSELNVKNIILNSTNEAVEQFGQIRVNENYQMEMQGYDVGGSFLTENEECFNYNSSGVNHKKPVTIELDEEQNDGVPLTIQVSEYHDGKMVQLLYGENEIFSIDDLGVTKIKSLIVNGDIVQTGATFYETHAEQVYTTKDHIILRDGAVSGLGLGQYTGLFAKIPDGTHDAGLVFDGNNTARVGDITYNEDDEPVYTATQALATRQDTPTDKGVAYYNATDYRFDTASGLLYDSGNLGINVSPTAQLHVKASANDKVAFIVDSGASPTAHLADWQINGVIKAYISSTGSLYADVVASNLYGGGGSTLTLSAGLTISHDLNDANSALTINNKQGTGNIATFQYGNATKSAINKDGVLVDNSGSAGTDGTFLKKVSGAMAWTQPTKSDVGLENVANPNIYGNIAVSEDLDAIVFSGLYTCYGTATGVPNADYSWFIFHMNSGVGTTYAKQIAFAYDGKIFERFKNTTWGAWKVLGSGNGVDWTNLTLETGWTAVENYTPQYKVMPHGAVYVRGRVTRGTGGSSTITILPSGYRPSQPTDYINSSNNGGSLVVMSINSTGTITSSVGEGVVVELNYTFAL